jgi:D-alanyl-D-alanine carboxypeptidase (penicillin-binding protein 5/6)
MQDSHFTNVTGLPDRAHVTTAHDMAILARAIIKNFPETYKIYSQKEFTYNGIKQSNRNKLLYRNAMVDGIKTGHTDSAGYCLVASAMDPNGMRLISIVMGTKSDNARTEEANKLLSWGFRFYETHAIRKAGEPLEHTAVWMGKKKELNVGFADDLYITTIRGDYKKYTETTNLVNFIKAPINQGEVVGSYVVRDMNKQVVVERPIVALTSIRKGNIWQRGRDYVKLNVKSLFEKYNG